jgi:hypothetical protein
MAVPSSVTGAASIGIASPGSTIGSIIGSMAGSTGEGSWA